MTLDEPSVTENAATDILPWNIPTSSYLHGLDPNSKWASAVDADLTVFPPTYLSWGGDDVPCLIRSIRRTACARRASRRMLTRLQGMFHVFQIACPGRRRAARPDSRGPNRTGVVDDAPP